MPSNDTPTSSEEQHYHRSKLYDAKPRSKFDSLHIPLAAMVCQLRKCLSYLLDEHKDIPRLVQFVEQYGKRRQVWCSCKHCDGVKPLKERERVGQTFVRSTRDINYQAKFSPGVVCINVGELNKDLVFINAFD